MSPQEAVDRYNDEAFFVVAVHNGTAPRKQLAELNCKRIVPYPFSLAVFAAHAFRGPRFWSCLTS